MKINLKSKITRFMLFVMSIFLLFITVSVTYIIERKLLNQQIDLLQKTVKIIQQEIGNELLDIVYSTNELRSDKEFLQFLSENPNKNKIQLRLNSTFSKYKTISTILLLDKNNNELYSLSPSDNVKDYLPLLEIANNSNREDYFASPNYTPLNKTINQDYITYIGKIRDIESYSLKNKIIIRFNKGKVLASLLKYTTSFNDILIVDNNNTTIYSTIKNEKEEEELKSYNLKYYNLTHKKVYNKMLLFQEISDFTTWKIITTINMFDLRKANLEIYFILILLTLISFVWIFYNSNKLANQVTVPIKNIQNTLTALEQGDLSARIEMPNDDVSIEIFELINGYNHMAEHLEHSINTMLDTHEEIKRNEIESVKFKYELLQNQINPHFIFNTLNTVTYLAMKNKPDEIITLIQSLNALLRAVMNTNEEYVTLKQEFEFLKEYVKLQNYRLDSPIKLDYILPKELENIKILKLVIQPIVENAIIHGILPKGGEDGRILLRVFDWKDNDHTLEVVVVDNGIGIKEEDITKLEKKGLNSIGLSNINERIKLIYNNSLEITGYKGLGTVIVFKIYDER